MCFCICVNDKECIVSYEIKGICKIVLFYMGVVVWILIYLFLFNIEELMVWFGLFESSVGWFVFVVFFCFLFFIVIFGWCMVMLNKRVGVLIVVVFVVLLICVMFMNNFYVFVVVRLIFGVVLGVSCVCVYGVIVYVKYLEKVVV